MSTNNINTLNISPVDVLKAIQMILTSANMEPMQIARIMDKVYEEQFGFSALKTAGVSLDAGDTTNGQPRKAGCTTKKIGDMCTLRLRAIEVESLLEEAGYNDY